MQCQLCNSGENETQEHLERCDFTREMRTNLDLGKLKDKVVLWRKLTRALQNVYTTNKNVNKESSTHNENYSCDGNTTHAFEAFSARDMSVGVVICDRPVTKYSTFVFQETSLFSKNKTKFPHM